MNQPRYKGYAVRTRVDKQPQYLFNPIGLSKDALGHYKLSGKRLFGKWLARVDITAEDGMELNIRDLRRSRATFFAMAPSALRLMNARNELHSAKVEEMVYTHVEDDVTKLVRKEDLLQQARTLINYLPEDKKEGAALYVNDFERPYKKPKPVH